MHFVAKRDAWHRSTDHKIHIKCSCPAGLGISFDPFLKFHMLGVYYAFYENKFLPK